MIKSKSKFSDTAFPYLMCIPAVILFTMFVITPFIRGLWTSFFRWDGMSEMKWIALNNYKFVFEDAVFWKAMGNTFYYAFFVTIFKNIIGLTLGIIMAKKIFCRTLFRVSAYMPVTFSYVVIGVLWSWIYNPMFGILNKFLMLVGAGSLIQGWLSDPNIALSSVMVVDVWKWMGFHMVLYMAGLQAISKDIYEAAEIDGANAIIRFWKITIPQLNSTLVLNIMLSVTGAFMTNYNLVNIMTGGGPFHSTEVLLTYIVRTAFSFSSLGKANAMSIILFIFVFTFAFAQLKVMTRDENYE